MLWGIDKNWTLFLDRDGVINVRIFDDYIKQIEEFQFLEGVPESIAAFSKIFNHVFVVTNQQGIGKGLMTESNLFEIHDYMCSEIKTHGGIIAACYHAPELSSENSVLRKPSSGMALKAKKDFPSIDFEKSVMIGDSDSDIEFGKRLGMKTVKISNESNDSSKADLYVTSLQEFLIQLTK